MTVLLDQEITGNGQYNFGGNQVQFALVYLDQLGPEVFVSDPLNSDLLMKAGWLSFGSETDLVEATNQVYWNERIWINFQRFQWHPQPTVWGNNAPDFAVWASHVRWSLSVDTHGFLVIIGL